MLTEEQKLQLRVVINDSLTKAERHWINGGYQLLEKRAVMDSINSSMEGLEAEPSKIPGHALVQDDETIIDEFIAFVADMRESSRHLMCAISDKKAKVTNLERVYYETSALLPALGLTVKFSDGNVTEYLGDGVLALFKVDPDDKRLAIYNAYAAAKNSISITREIVNAILNERYNLPEINLGVGLAMSKTIVSLVGLEGDKHPKAFGECIFRATKLSGGMNEIYADSMVRGAWPSSKGGSLSFIAKRVKDQDGYLITRNK
ncbi:MAG: hypothetical protein VB954_16340 [Thalassolituus sp.]|uniref:hypothetical protein n=1 Tax=Thalassolituus sp. TaxID=2030822 RepID=UPI0039824959